ncbi:hypothetical protein CG717_16125 [Streptomyces sp. CB02613]|uniref:hypothetical protein n=1 Tax=Streptomyces sp. CB02613 TaxID=2020328 RepID=UPI000C2711F0|nr:hypothetical protein [Streptomyces sp. CB02613]PJN31294.1 hypothetical protein CG717_16125 [Streptomyces sp. CB02613]
MTTPDPRDQHIADLRAALDRARRYLAFAAGLEAAPAPEHSQTLMSEAAHLEQVLARTAPEPTGA